MYIGYIEIPALYKVGLPVKMVNQPEDPNKYLDRFDITHPWVQERIHYFAKDTTEKILRNMAYMEIHPHRSLSPSQKKKFTGDLKRSIHWTIVSTAKGDMTMVEFYYLFYGKFLEMSASGWLNDKYGPVTSGKVPAMTDKSGVWVRTNGMRRPWKAKPFISSEIRRQAKRLLKRLAEQFAYAGGMQIFSGFVMENQVVNGAMSIQEHSEHFWKFIHSGMTKTEIKLV